MSKPVAIVTGGASGIGLALVRHLLSKGYCVAIVDVNATEGEKLVDELGPEVIFFPADVSSYAAQKDIFRKTFSWGGNRLDLLVANAGIEDRQSIYQIDEETAEDDGPSPLNIKALEVNLIAVIQGLWLFKYYARKNKVPGGKVITTSSAAGLYPMPTGPQYSASKHALVGLTRSVGTEFVEEGITVNCICPAFVVTNLCPKHVLDKFPKEHITPMSSILKACDTILADDALSAQVMEVSLDRFYFRKQPEYPNESQRWLGENSAAFWEEAYKNPPEPKNGV